MRINTRFLAAAELLAIAAMALPATVSAQEFLDFNVGVAGNMRPRGMWGNSEVLWVADYLDSKLYAYAMADGSRLASRDIETRVGDTREGARYPTDVWSDGQIAWVTDNEFDRIYAYRLSDGGRVPDQDLSLSAANSQPTGLWGNGETMWVTDKGDGRVYAYALADGSRVPALDFELSAPGGGTLAWAWGLWSDGEMFRVVDFKDKRVYAYRGGGRAPEGDIDNLVEPDADRFVVGRSSVMGVGLRDRKVVRLQPGITGPRDPTDSKLGRHAVSSRR